MTTSSQTSAVFASRAEVSEEQVRAAAIEGYCVPVEDSGEEVKEDAFDELTLVGDEAKLTPNQRRCLMHLKEATTYPRIKIKQISLSFSGACVFFFSPFRKDGTPMPSSVLKFDVQENVEEEVGLTQKYGTLFGLTTPKVKATHFLTDVDKNDPSGLMQIDLCGGCFGLPEFASAPPVHTFASVLEAELASEKRQVDVVPIINEALERRMHTFTMSSRKVRKVDLAAMYKIIRFVGHGVLNRAAEGAKRAKKSPALAAGFQNPVDINQLDADGKFMQEICGRRETPVDFFKRFVSYEALYTRKFTRDVVTGLCHNDLHGGNLLLDSQGLVWLIDFATVKDDVHVLMDLAKFLASVLFLYLQDNVKESFIHAFAKILSTTPDATTAMPAMEGLAGLKEDKTATFILEIITRLRHCMCLYEVGDDVGSNDGTPFALALFSWSARMLSYSEPNLYQKTRALYFSLVCAQRILWEVDVDVGPTARGWIEEFRGIWEGQKGRRLSAGVTGVQDVAYNFADELPRYLAQLGTAEAWSTDFLTREKVHATDHCVAVSVTFNGKFFPRLIQQRPVTKAMLKRMEPIHTTYIPEVLSAENYCGRLAVIGGSGTGKSMMTRQLFAEACQHQLLSMHGAPDGGKAKSRPSARRSSQISNEGRGPLLQQPEDADVKIIPLRVPLVDLSRMLESDPDMSIDADPMGDLLSRWLERKYGQDSVAQKLITDVRLANVEDPLERQSTLSGGITPFRQTASSQSAEKGRVSMVGGQAQATGQEEAAEKKEEKKELMGLLLLLDGFDEASSCKAQILHYMESLMQTEPGHLIILTSRPGTIVTEDTKLLSFYGFTSFGMCELSDAEASDIAKGTLTRLGEQPDRIDAIITDVRSPGYKSLRAVPLILTLLVHVIRRFKARDASTTVSASAEAMNRTEIYRRAMRLILHQSDAAKFALREGQSDQAMVQRLEMLKSPRARKLFQMISWHAHCRRSRTFGWEEMQDVCPDTEALSVVQSAFQDGRLPIFDKVETVDGNDVVQFTHLSFQELMAGEYASAVVQHAHASDTTSAYMNYFLSNSHSSLERDRLSEIWWIQVWMHICEALNPIAFKEWCNILAEDEQSKVKVGTLLSYALFVPKNTTMDCEITDINWDEMCCRVKKVPRGCGQKAGLFYGTPDLSLDTEPTSKINLADAQWKHAGVAAIMRAAAASGTQVHTVETLMDKKVHFSTTDSYACSSFYNALESVSEKVIKLFSEKYNIQMTVRLVVDVEHREPAYRLMNRKKSVIRQVFKATRGGDILLKLPKCWLLEQARAGTLELGPDVDVNFKEPVSALTPLMVAAGYGQVELVRRLLSQKASVTQEDANKCTALTFAAESDYAGSAECLKLLIEAGSDIHHVAGNPWVENVWRYVDSYYIGHPSPPLKAVCRLGNMEKFDILVAAGYDIFKDEGSHHIWGEASMGGSLEMLKKLVSMGVDPTKAHFNRRNPGRSLFNVHPNSLSILVDDRDLSLWKYGLELGCPLGNYMKEDWGCHDINLIALSEASLRQDPEGLDTLFAHGFTFLDKACGRNGKGQGLPHIYGLGTLSNPWIVFYLLDKKMDPWVKIQPWARFVGCPYDVWKSINAPALQVLEDYNVRQLSRGLPPLTPH